MYWTGRNEDDVSRLGRETLCIRTLPIPVLQYLIQFEIHYTAAPFSWQ